MEKGIVKWYEPEKRYGFITKEDGTDIFVHASGIVSETHTIETGQHVTFDLSENAKGPIAINVFVEEE